MPVPSGAPSETIGPRDPSAAGNVRRAAAVSTLAIARQQVLTWARERAIRTAGDRHRSCPLGCLPGHGQHRRAGGLPGCTAGSPRTPRRPPCAETRSPADPGPGRGRGRVPDRLLPAALLAAGIPGTHGSADSFLPALACTGWTWPCGRAAWGQRMPAARTAAANQAARGRKSCTSGRRPARSPQASFLADAWWVAAEDPELGRNDRLWPALAGFARTATRPARDRQQET